MSHPGRFRSRAVAGLIAILLAVPLASAGGAQPQAQARSLEGMGGWSISTPRSEAFAQSMQQRDNSRDVLPKALLTVGGAAAAAFLGLVGYMIRRRLGFWLHRPQTPDDRAAEEHR